MRGIARHGFLKVLVGSALFVLAGTLDAAEIRGLQLSTAGDATRAVFDISAPLDYTFVDLGATPLCESYVSAERYNDPEPFYPLRAFVCGTCYLVQLEALVGPEEIFTEYAYFSSYSDSWVDHARRYTDGICERLLDLGAGSDGDGQSGRQRPQQRRRHEATTFSPLRGESPVHASTLAFRKAWASASGTAVALASRRP